MRRVIGVRMKYADQVEAALAGGTINSCDVTRGDEITVTLAMPHVALPCVFYNHHFVYYFCVCIAAPYNQGTGFVGVTGLGVAL